MSVYFIASYDIDDQDEYNRYVQGVIPTLMAHKGEVLVADYAANHLEGTPKHAHIVLRFENEAALMGWYNAPEYEPLKAQRLSITSNGTTVGAKQFVMPQG